MILTDKQRERPNFPFFKSKIQIPNRDLYGKAISWGREILYTRIGLLLTLLASGFVAYDIAIIASHSWSQDNIKLLLEQAVFFTVVMLLIYGNVLYQLTRIGYLKRLENHQPESREKLNRHFRVGAPRVTFLLPSYKEEPRVIRQSLLSTALQEYENKRVVLLIDDPISPRSKTDQELLNAARELPAEVEKMLEYPALKTEQFLADYVQRTRDGEIDPIAESLHLCEAYHQIGSWFANQAEDYRCQDHTDRFFVQEIFQKPALQYNQMANDLFHSVTHEEVNYQEKWFAGEYHRLRASFRAEITSFERKKYKNLSHEPNKAMNLNSYLGLLGRDFVEVEKKGELHLLPAGNEEADLKVPSSEFAITLDADSFLALDYALRLVHFMLQPGNNRVAVAQTPYSSIPEAPSQIERIAGATTDMQYLIHQGFTQYGATYWVGANALLRISALKDIEAVTMERGFRISKFIQDRTVIEDTESSIDLVAKNWKLYNYPERLSYSATPPDFGSLLIQRARWANGGLIILPKLIKYLFSRPYNFAKIKEGFMRFHYLFSIAAVNLSVLILLIYPFNDHLQNFWLPLTALPYYFFYGRDLLQAGYKKSDLYKVYAMNLMLIPINIAGVYKSVQQMITGRTIPFKRTPKVMGRTTASSRFVLAEYAILAYCLSGTVVDLLSERWLHASFSFFNVCFMWYAVQAFVRFKDANSDLYRAFHKQWVRSTNRCKKAVEQCFCPECAGVVQSS